jgi:ubiquinone/menaquinone biosynthesis C-methylase UbiE
VEARVSLGDAESLDLRDGAFDYVVSGLVINFVLRPGAAIAQMRRFTTVAGQVVAYVWDYAERMEMLRYVWDAATTLDPDAGAVTPSRRRDRSNR